MKLIFLLVLLILKEISSQSAFNIYKAYDKSNRRPPQYSSNRKRTTHGIDEYLSPQQRHMAKVRSSSVDSPENMWDASKVNGFQQFKDFKSQGLIAQGRRRNLIEQEEVNVNKASFDILQYLLSSGIFLICISVMSLLGVFFYKRAHREI